MTTEKPTPGYLVWRLATRWRVAVDRAVAPLGLTHAQYAVLASLYGINRRGEEPTQRQLADHTGLDAIYVSKLVRALESSGLLTRPADASDSRAVRLALTSRGRGVVTEAIAVVAELLDRLTAPLGGTRSKRTAALVAELETLLANPLTDPPAGADQ